MGKLTQVDLTKLPGHRIFRVGDPLVAGAFIVLGEEVACPCFSETAKNVG